MALSDEQIAEFQRLIPLAKVDGARVGPMHSIWEVILDAEALMKGEKAIVDDPEYLLAELRKYDA